MIFLTSWFIGSHEALASISGKVTIACDELIDNIFISRFDFGDLYACR